MKKRKNRRGKDTKRRCRTKRKSLLNMALDNKHPIPGESHFYETVLFDFGKVIVFDVHDAGNGRGLPAANAETFFRRGEELVRQADAEVLLVVHGWRNGNRWLKRMAEYYDNMHWQPDEDEPGVSLIQTRLKR